MYKATFTCPTCDEVFEREVHGLLEGAAPSVRYCSVKCNTWLESRVGTPATCECGKDFDSYDGKTKCHYCLLPSGLRNALAKIEAEFGGGQMEYM